MNKPLAFLCCLIGVPGLVILACALYFCVAYGHGDLEAGNFHRCSYSVERDAATGRPHRSYDTRWELVSSTEGSAVAQYFNMWVLGFGLPLTAAALFAADSWARRQPGF